MAPSTELLTACWPSRWHACIWWHSCWQDTRAVMEPHCCISVWRWKSCSDLFWPRCPLLPPRDQTCDGNPSTWPPCICPTAPTPVVASVLKHLTSSFEITVTGTAYICCIPVYTPFTNPQQHEDAAHGGGRGPERGDGYLSADWAVLLMKDNDKPGFIVRSCSLLTAYDEYLQKGSEGGSSEIICYFFAAGFLPEKRPVWQPPSLQPSV